MGLIGVCCYCVVGGGGGVLIRAWSLGGVDWGVLLLATCL